MEKNLLLNESVSAPDFWATGKYFLIEYRYKLIDQLNAVAGHPSYELARIQARFLLCRMAPGESLAFIQVCLGLIQRAPCSRLLSAHI